MSTPFVSFYGYEKDNNQIVQHNTLYKNDKSLRVQK